MQRLKKATALIVVFVMMTAMMVTASATAIFPDVDSSDQYATAISLLKLLQITSGDQNGRFNPTQTITRAEFTKILYVLMNGTPDVSLFVGKSSFTDVAENAWYNGYVNWASNSNIVSGKGNKKFAPLDPVTSQEATKMFVVALTGKSTLTWPYGFVTEASKPNINLFKGAVVKDATKPAPRNLIAQYCYNAIFASDVSTFYEYDSNGKVIARPSAATAVFGLKSLQTVIYESSSENWALSGIKLDGILSVKNENAEIVQIPSPTPLSGSYAGYTAGIYYQDANRNGRLDASSDTILSVTLGNCAAATAKPVNIISVNNTYQMTGLTFNPNTDLATGSKLIVMSPTGNVTSTILTQASLVSYLGELSTTSTATNGIAADYDVRVVKDITSGKINAVYITQPITVAKVVSYNQTTGVITLDDAQFGTKSTVSSGIAPNMTKVIVTAGVKSGDYVTAVPSRDYNGITWQVKPLLVDAGVTMTAIKSDGTPMFGDKTYRPNIAVSSAVVSGRLPNSEALLTVANLGAKFDVYLDSTGTNYLYMTVSSNSTVVTENYVFVKSVNTTTAMGMSNYSMTVADKTGQSRTYPLNLAMNGDPYGYLTGNVATGCSGWTSPDGSYGNIVILNKVIKLTTNGAGEVTRIDNMGGTSTTKLTYDANTKILSDNGTVVGTMDAASTIFYWKNSTLTIYTSTNLSSFSNATATYSISNLRLNVALVTDMGSSTSTVTTSTSRGIILGYSIVAGNTTGKVKYIISAVLKNSVPVTLTSVDEVSGGLIGTALGLIQSGIRFADITISSDNYVTALSMKSIVAGAALTSGVDGWFAGTVSVSSGNIYQMKGLNIADGKLVATVGDAVTYTLSSGAEVYTIDVSPINNQLLLTSANYAVGTPSNLAPLTQDIAYVVVYHTNASNVIDSAFVFRYILRQQ